MKKIVLILTLLFSTKAFSQVYQLMNQYGYNVTRMNFDSTLQIPTVCGVPTLKTVYALKKSALAFDSCNNRFYYYNPKTAVWSVITGGGGSTDTSSLSNRINEKIDSLKRVKDSVFAYKNGNATFQYKDSIGNFGTGTRNYVAKWDSTLKLTNSQIFDSALNVGIGTTNPLYKLDVNGNGRIGNLEINTTSDAERTGEGIKIKGIDSTFEFQGSTKANNMFEFSSYLSDTAKTNLTNNDFGIIRINSGFKSPNTINLSGNVLWLTPSYNFLYNQQAGTTVRGIYYNPTIADLTNTKHIAFQSTSGDIVFNNTKIKSTYDSIAVFDGDTLKKAVKPTTTNGGQNGRFGNDTATVVMALVHNDAGVTLTNGKVVAFSISGTNSNAPSVRLANNKGDSTSANTLGFVTGTIAVNDTGWVILSGKIEKLNTSAFSNGDIIYLDSVSGNWTKTKPVAPYHMVYLGVVVKANAGNGAIFVKAQNGYELDEIHDVQINSKVNNQVLAYSDTQKVWKNRNIYSIVDTTTTIATKTNVSAKLNISDTANMLTNYARTIAINGKLNISDTTVFQRKIIGAYSFQANKTFASAATTSNTFRDTSGAYTGSITWVGTAPSGTQNFSYKWTQIGKMVTLNVTLVYGTNGAAVTQVNMTLPSDCPTPLAPTGVTGNLRLLYAGSGSLSGGLFPIVAARAGLINNATSTGFDLVVASSSGVYNTASITIQYYTN